MPIDPAIAIANYMHETMNVDAGAAATFAGDMLVALTEQGLVISEAGQAGKVTDAHRNSALAYAIQYAKGNSYGNVLDVAGQFAAFLAGVAAEPKITAEATDRVPGT